MSDIHVIVGGHRDPALSRDHAQAGMTVDEVMQRFGKWGLVTVRSGTHHRRLRLSGVLTTLSNSGAISSGVSRADRHP